MQNYAYLDDEKLHSVVVAAKDLQIANRIAEFKEEVHDAALGLVICEAQKQQHNLHVRLIELVTPPGTMLISRAETEPDE